MPEGMFGRISKGILVEVPKENLVTIPGEVCGGISQKFSWRSQGAISAGIFRTFLREPVNVFLKGFLHKYSIEYSTTYSLEVYLFRRFFLEFLQN